MMNDDVDDKDDDIDNDDDDDDDGNNIDINSMEHICMIREIKNVYFPLRCSPFFGGAWFLR